MEQTRFYKILFDDDTLDPHLFNSEPDARRTIEIYREFGKEVKGLGIIIVAKIEINEN